MKKSWCALGALLLCAFSEVAPTLAQNICLTGDFEEQAEALLRYLRLPEEIYSQLPQVTSDIERVLQTHWPGCRVKRFGSTVTGLALKSSDVDCYIDIPGNTRDPVTLVAEALDILNNHSRLFQQFEISPISRVPLLTCVHVPTNIFVDMSFSNAHALDNSLLASYLMHLDKRALDLATIIKYWGSVHDIANGRLTLPSYAVVLMTVFYLQQKNILPTVLALQQDVKPYEYEHWNIAFRPIQHHTDNNDTLYELLGGFFKYYSDFDFENMVIAPYVGYPIKKTHFVNLDNLKDYSLYRHNVANGLVEPFQFGYINIQDTINHNQNVGRPGFGQRLADRLIKQVSAAAKWYDVLSSEEFLTALLVPEKRIEAGVLKTFWSGGVGDRDQCRRNKLISIQ